MEGVRFRDANLRLACLDVLFDLGHFAAELEGIHEISVPSNEFEPNSSRLAAMNQIAVTQEHLDQIKHLAPDGGDDIYFHVFPHWGGSEDDLYIASFVDLGMLRNLRRLSVHAVTAPSSLDLTVLLPLEKLIEVSTDWFYIDRTGAPDATIAALRNRGVAVSISGNPKYQAG